MGMPYTIVAYNASPYMVACSGDLSSTFTSPATMPPRLPGSVAISPDGLTVVACSEFDKLLYVYTMTLSGLVFTRSVTLPSNVSSSNRLTFSPDGTRLMLSGANENPQIIVWNTTTWTTVTAPTPTLPAADVLTSDWSPDGSLIAIGQFSSPYLRLHRTSDMAAVSNLASMPTEAVRQAKFSNDGSILALVTQSRTSFHRVADRSMIGSSNHPVADPSPPNFNHSSCWQPGTNNFTLALGSGSSNTQFLAQFAVTMSGITKSLPDTQPSAAGRVTGWNKAGDDLFFGYAGNPTRIARYNSGLVKQADPIVQPTGFVFDIVRSELPDEPQTRPVIFLTG